MNADLLRFICFGKMSFDRVNDFFAFFGRISANPARVLAGVYE